MGWANRNIPRTLYLVYGIGGYFYASLFTNFPIPTLIVTLVTVALISGIVAYNSNDGRMPNA